MGLCWVLTVQKLGVNVPQDICHPQLLFRTGPSMDPQPGRFRQSRAQRCDGQSSGQGRHQAPLRLLGQGGAPSPPPTPRDSRTRRGIHVYPISLSSLAVLVSLYYQDVTALNDPLLRSANRLVKIRTVNRYSQRYLGDEQMTAALEL